MSKYYELTKSNYSKDIDHLVTFNKKWSLDKRKSEKNQRIIAAAKPRGYNLVDVTIFHLDKKSNLLEKLQLVMQI